MFKSVPRSFGFLPGSFLLVFLGWPDLGVAQSPTIEYRQRAGRYEGTRSKPVAGKELGIYDVELSSGSVKKLTNDMAYYAAPVWSPNGKWMAYLTNTGSGDEERDVFVMPSDGTQAKRFTKKHQRMN